MQKIHTKHIINISKEVDIFLIRHGKVLFKHKISYTFVQYLKQLKLYANICSHTYLYCEVFLERWHCKMTFISLQLKKIFKRVKLWCLTEIVRTTYDRNLLDFDRKKLCIPTLFFPLRWFTVSFTILWITYSMGNLVRNRTVLEFFKWLLFGIYYVSYERKLKIKILSKTAYGWASRILF